MRESAIRLEKIKLGSGKSAFQLYANIGGQRFRERFGCEVEAIGRQCELQKKLEDYQSYPPMMPTTLTRTQLADAEIAIRHLSKRFPDRSLSWAVTALCDLDPEKPELELEEAISKFLELKLPVVNRKSGRDYKSTLKRFLDANGMIKAHEARHTHVTRYFEFLKSEVEARKRNSKRNQAKGKAATTSFELSNGTYNHHLARLTTFFIWIEKAYPDARLAKRNPCDGISKRARSEMTREILLPEDATNVMQFAEKFEGGRLVNYISFALFAGIRPDVEGELGKMTSLPTESYLDWKHDLVRLSSQVTKSNRPREIDIPPALKAFLKAYPLEKYPLQPKKRRHERRRTDQQVLRNSLERFRTACPVPLPHDVLRHSYISYHLRLSGEYAETSRQAGNTEEIIRRHYQRRVTREEASQFWAIRPTRSRSLHN